MKKLNLFLILALILPILSSCASMNEPNNIAYIVAVGVDMSDNADNYEITLQFAKPVQISGGASDGGGGSGKDITENMTFVAPTLYSAINLANQQVSKKFSLSHAKLFVFSEKIAREGLRDFMETMVRSMEIRPNIYMAVSLSTAKEYLESVQPMIEVSPVKYYELIYENKRSLYTPNNRSQDFYFSQNAPDNNNVLPLANVLPKSEKDEKQQNSSGEGEGGGSSSSESSGGSSGEGGSSATPKPKPQELYISRDGFDTGVSNFIAGQMPRESGNRSETLGMAIFTGDKMTGIMGSVEAELYNIITGSFDYTYTTFTNQHDTNTPPITIRLEQNKKPYIRVTKGEKPQIQIKLFLEGQFYSLPADYIVEQEVEQFQNHVSEVIARAAENFMYKTSREYGSDIVGTGSHARRSFWTYQKFAAYNWSDKFKYADFDVEVKFTIRRTGLTIRGGGE